jgi:hypothetical protein
MLLPDSTFELHYSIAQLAKLWNIGREAVRLLVKDEPGIFRLSLGRKKSMVRYSIPASVAQRIHARMTAGGTFAKAA